MVCPLIINHIHSTKERGVNGLSEGGFFILVFILMSLGIIIYRLDKRVHYFPPNSELGAEGQFYNEGKDSHYDFDFLDGDDGGGDGD